MYLTLVYYNFFSVTQTLTHILLFLCVKKYIVSYMCWHVALTTWAPLYSLFCQAADIYFTLLLTSLFVLFYERSNQNQ